MDEKKVKIKKVGVNGDAGGVGSGGGNVEIDEKYIREVLDRGLTCCAEVEVGEVVQCLSAMFRHIQDTDMVQGFKKALNLEHNEDVDKFLILLFVSEIATITMNFAGREEHGAQA